MRLVARRGTRVRHQYCSDHPWLEACPWPCCARRRVHSDRAHGRWQVVQTIARGDVQEIRTGPTRGRRALGFLVGVGGAFGGMVLGGTIGGAGSDAEDFGGVALGAAAGLVGGAVLGDKAITHTKGELIYRVP
jgi:hypothetical protein